MNKQFLVPAITDRLNKVNELLKPLEDKIKPLQEERDKLFEFLKGADVNLSEIESNANRLSSYQISSSWWEKSKLILTSENRPLTIGEIVTFVKANEPNITHKNLSKSISNAMTPKEGTRVNIIRKENEPNRFELM